MKGEDMILSDFLSQQENDDSNPHEIIHISFNVYRVLENKFYDDKYLIQTRSQAKSSGIKLPEVHGMRQNLDPDLKPERQHTIPKQASMERLHVGQGRAESKIKKPDPINHAIKQASNLSQKFPGKMEIETRKTNHMHTKDQMHSINNVNDKMANSNPLIQDGTDHPGPFYRPPPKPIKQNMTHIQSSQSSNIDNNNSDINFDFEENFPFQEGIMSKTFQRWDKSFFQEPKELGDLINKGNFIHKYLPKQTDIDRILEIIQRKVLNGTHLPVEIKEIQAGYIYSPYFKDLYLYLSQNKLPSSKLAIRKIEALAEKYVLLDSLFFKISSDKETAVLAVPELCAERIITLYRKVYLQDTKEL